MTEEEEYHAMINGIVKLILGKEVALALKFLRAGYKIFDSIKDGARPNVAPFARALFAELPEGLKHPKGPAKEQEFIDAMYNVFSLFVK